MLCVRTISGWRAQAQRRGRFRSGHDGNGEVGDLVIGHVGGGQHPLTPGAGPLDVVGLAQLAGIRECPAHRGIGAAELHDGSGIGVAQAFGEFVDSHRARQHGQHLFALDQRGAECRRRRAHRGDAGDDLGLEPVGQPPVHMHVGAVEQRIARGQQRDAAPGGQVSGQSFGGLLVELVDGALIAAGVIGGLGRHRVDEMFFELTRPHVRFGDGARDAASVPCAVEGDHVGRADDPRRLDRHQFRVAGAEPDAPQFARRGHSCSLAIAFSAEAVMALPPRLPRTVR